MLLLPVKRNTPSVIMLHDYTTERDILYILYLSYPPDDLPFLRLLSLEPLGKVMSSVGVGAHG